MGLIAVVAWLPAELCVLCIPTLRVRHATCISRELHFRSVHAGVGRLTAGWRAADDRERDGRRLEPIGDTQRATTEGFLGRGLEIVMRFTKTLPIRLIPKSHLVASMRDDVIDHGCRRHAAARTAFDAEGIGGEPSEARLLPAVAVPARR